MFNRNWSNHTTFKHRYESTGILDFVLEHLKQQKTTNPVIIDAGCSTGIAMKTAADIMKTIGFTPYTVGIDMPEKG